MDESTVELSLPQATHIYIPEYIMARSDLSLTEKLLVGKIIGLSSKEGYCFATNQYLARQMGKDRTTVSRYIAKLVRKGILMQGAKMHESGLFNVRTLTPYSEFARGGCKNALQQCKNAYPYSKEVSSKTYKVPAAAEQKLQDVDEKGNEHKKYPNLIKTYSNRGNWEWRDEDWQALEPDELWELAMKLNVKQRYVVAQQNQICHLIKEGVWQDKYAFEYNGMPHAIERRILFALERGWCKNLTESERETEEQEMPSAVERRQKEFDEYFDKILEKKNG